MVGSDNMIGSDGFITVGGSGNIIGQETSYVNLIGSDDNVILTGTTNLTLIGTTGGTYGPSESGNTYLGGVLLDDIIAGSLNSIIGVTAGSGLTGGGTGSHITLDVNVSNGITIINDYVQINPTLAGNGLTFSSGVMDISVVKGVTFSGDALSADASTIVTTGYLSNIGSATGSSIQSVLSSIDTNYIWEYSGNDITFNTVGGTTSGDIIPPNDGYNDLGKTSSRFKTLHSDYILVGEQNVSLGKGSIVNGDSTTNDGTYTWSSQLGTLNYSGVTATSSVSTLLTIDGVATHSSAFYPDNIFRFPEDATIFFNVDVIGRSSAGSAYKNLYACFETRTGTIDAVGAQTLSAALKNDTNIDGFLAEFIINNTYQTLELWIKPESGTLTVWTAAVRYTMIRNTNT